MPSHGLTFGIVVSVNRSPTFEDTALILFITIIIILFINPLFLCFILIFL